ncbi:hypothetical protein ABGB18_48085 [Nonomuraea sp. B12E4]|uniref:hypothetical protein n=1 Tax=Nonomuraea sp. B12E4 TaxID=3153564 RepID=UPI00325E6881
MPGGLDKVLHHGSAEPRTSTPGFRLCSGLLEELISGVGRALPIAEFCVQAHEALVSLSARRCAGRVPKSM